MTTPNRTPDNYDLAPLPGAQPMPHDLLPPAEAIVATPTVHPRGGARAGAGRPPKPDKDRLVKLSVALTPPQDAYVASLAAEYSLTQSEILRMLVEQAKQTAEGAGPTPLPEAIAMRILTGLKDRLGLHLDPRLGKELALAASAPLAKPKARRRKPRADCIHKWHRAAPGGGFMCEHCGGTK